MYQLQISGKELEDILAKKRLELYNCVVNGNYLSVTIDFSMTDGTEIKFKAPISSSTISGIKVTSTYGGSSSNRTFSFVDAHGNSTVGVELFTSGAVVKIILDTKNNKAYVQNADTNSYLEEKILPDTTLTQTGKAADAKATGDAFATLKNSPIVLQRGVHYGKESEIPSDFPEGGLWLRVVE